MTELKTIGVILDDNSKEGLNHTYFSRILESFKLEIEKKGMSLLFLNNDRSRPGAKRYAQQLKDYGCVGCMIACIDNGEEIDEVLKAGLPVVAVDKNYEDAINVSSDNNKGMELLTEYAIEMGHKKIAIIMGDDNEVTNIRLNGYLRVCEKHHIQIPAEYICRGKFRDMNQAIYHTEKLLQLENSPTLIIYSDDYASIGGMNILHARGLTVPKDISIAGYDGNILISKYEPQLTTVAQDGEEMGRVAAEKMIASILDPSVSQNGSYCVDVQLVKGRTIRQIYG